MALDEIGQGHQRLADNLPAEVIQPGQQTFMLILPDSREVAAQRRVIRRTQQAQELINFYLFEANRLI